jgi:hypothetical protein
MKNQPCNGCPEQEHFVGVSKTPITVALPQAYFNSNVNLASTLPRDSIERQFQRPVFAKDGSFEYPRTGDVPPDEVDGYQRDPENGWRFVPVWPACRLRLMGTRMKPNGCIEIVAMCNNPALPIFGKPVICQTCTDCEARK